MDIDLQTLAANALAVLTPFVTSLVAKAEETMTEKIVDGSIEQGRRLYTMIFQRFKKVDNSDKAVKVLENFRDDPQEYESNLQHKLIDIIQSDQRFATELQQFFKQDAVQEIIARSESTAHRNIMTNSTNKGIQRMVAEDNSHLEDNKMHLG